MKIRLILPAVVLGSLILAAGLPFVTPAVVLAQCGVPGGPACPPEKEKKKTPTSVRSTQTLTPTATFTPTATPTVELAVGGAEAPPTHSNPGLLDNLGPIIGIVVIGGFVLFVLGLLIGGGAWLRGIVVIGGKPVGGSEKGVIVIGGKPVGGSEKGVIVIGGKPVGDALDPSPHLDQGIGDPGIKPDDAGEHFMKY